jgi:hypothetical protein
MNYRPILPSFHLKDFQIQNIRWNLSKPTLLGINLWFRKTYLPSSSPMGHKTSTICLHLPLSFAMYRVWPIEKPISSSSDIIVLVYVVLGLPLFLLPGGVQCRATLGILLGVVLITCPSHLIRLCFISPTMFLHLPFLNSSLLLI